MAVPEARLSLLVWDRVVEVSARVRRRDVEGGCATRMQSRGCSKGGDGV